MKRLTIIKGLMAKDVSQIFSNKFVVTMTIMSIVAYSVIYYVMPNTIDESFDIAIHAPKSGEVFEGSAEEREGIKIESLESIDELKERVKKGDFNAGIAMPENFEQVLQEQKRPENAMNGNTAEVLQAWPTF